MTTTESQRLHAADLQRSPSRPVAWLREHPVVADLLVVAAACAPQVVVLVARSGDVSWLGHALVAVVACALMARRHRPFTVLVVVAVTCAGAPLLGAQLAFPTLPFSFALYTVASRQTTTRALLGYATAMAATVLATVPYSLSGTQPPLISLVDPFSLVALAAGILVKSRRDHTRWVAETVNQRIENAALAERARISAEMHDLVAHSLTVIVTLANGASSAWGKYPERSQEAVGQIAEVGREALQDMHRTLTLLRSADSRLDSDLHRSGDNLPTLDELTERFRTAGLRVTLSHTGPPLPDDPALRQAVYRIVQESLTNVLRHARRPSAATVVVDHGDERIVLTVDDDGEPVSRPVTPGYGLVGIGQRAAALDGHAESGPRPSGGWRVRVVLGTRSGGQGEERPRR